MSGIKDVCLRLTPIRALIVTCAVILLCAPAASAQTPPDTTKPHAAIRTTEPSVRPGQLVHLQIRTHPHVRPVKVCFGIDPDARIRAPPATGPDDEQRYRCRTAAAGHSRTIRATIRGLDGVYAGEAGRRLTISVSMRPEGVRRQDWSYTEVLVPLTRRPIARLVPRLPDLAFTRPSGIWVSTAASDQRHRQITSAAARHLTWEPEGNSLIFARTDGGLWRVRTDGSGLTRITPPCSGDGWPAVSPTGRYLAFVRQMPTGPDCPATPFEPGTSQCQSIECTHSANVMLLDRRSGDVRAVLTRSGAITDLAWDARRPSVLYGLHRPQLDDGLLLALDTVTGEVLPRRSQPVGMFTSIGVSASGDRLWAGTPLGTRLLRLPSMAQSYSYFSTIETSGPAAWEVVRDLVEL